MLRPRLLLAAPLAALLMILAVPAFAADDPAYIGTAACAGCHADEHKAWQDSHHDHAMRHAGPDTIELDAPLDRIPLLVRATAADRLLPIFEDLP